MRFLDLLRSRYPKLLQERFKVTEQEYEGLEPFDLLELVGKKRGMMLSGGVVNTERAAITVLDEFRSGKIGRISLERPHTGCSDGCAGGSVMRKTQRCSSLMHRLPRRVIRWSAVWTRQAEDRWAGPVVAAAVILPPQEQLLERWPQLAQLNDSKKLSEKSGSSCSSRSVRLP